MLLNIRYIIAVIVGPSGGGKTTLLRCVTGLEICDNGSIEINNKYLCKNGIYKAKKEFNEIRKYIGLVFQNFNLFPHMKVIENIIEAPIRVLNKSKEESVKKADVGSSKHISFGFNAKALPIATLCFWPPDN